MLDINYCQECREKLEDCGELAVTLFETICEAWIDTEQIHLVEDECTYIRDYIAVAKYLESKGFIVTTESGINTLAIKPIGLMPIDDYQTFTFCLEHKE